MVRCEYQARTGLRSDLAHGNLISLGPTRETPNAFTILLFKFKAAVHRIYGLILEANLKSGFMATGNLDFADLFSTNLYAVDRNRLRILLNIHFPLHQSRITFNSQCR